MSFWIREYGVKDEKRCTLHKVPGRSGCTKIYFSPPLPMNMAMDSYQEAYRDTGIMKMD
jgi:hypothetical protein